VGGVGGGGGEGGGGEIGEGRNELDLFQPNQHFVSGSSISQFSSFCGPKYFWDDYVAICIKKDSHY